MPETELSSNPQPAEAAIALKAPPGSAVQIVYSPDPPESADPDQLTIDVRFYSGAIVNQRDWNTGRLIPVQLEMDGCDLSRVAQGSCALLDTHTRYSSETQLGQVVKAWRTAGGWYATLKFAESRRDLFADYAAGSRRSVSLGADIVEYVDEVGADGEIKLRRVTKWLLTEISAVSVPADPGAVTLSQPQTQTQTQENRTMPETTGNAQQQTAVVDTAAIAASAVTAERERIAALNQTASQHRLDATFLAQHVNAGTTVAEFNGLALAHIAARQEQTETRSHHGVVTMDARDKHRAAMGLALAHRANPAAVKIDGDARQYAGMSLLRMAEECVIQAGGNPRGADRHSLATAALNLNGLELGMHSTSDFPNILAATANKTLLEAYAYANPTYKRWAKQSSIADFKPTSRNRFGEFPGLVKVVEGAEITMGTITEGKESYQLSTFGRRFAVTRQAIINDDLGAFSGIPAGIGVQVALLENTTAYGVLTANAALSDSVALFHATHGNLAGSGGAIAIATLDAGQSAMMLQKGLDAKTPLNVAPRFLIAPVAKRVTALQFTNAPGVVLTKSSDFNPFNGALEVIADAQLDANSTTAWYLAADPMMVPTVEYAYLEGQTGPRIENRTGWEVDGVEVKVTHDFAAKAIDYRGLYKNAGA